MTENKTLITLRINNKTLEKWDTFCKNQELRRSDLIRTAVNNFISSSSGKTIESLIDDLFHKYSQNLTKKIVQDQSLIIINQMENLKAFFSERLISLVEGLIKEDDTKNIIQESSKDVERIQH